MALHRMLGVSVVIMLMYVRHRLLPILTLHVTYYLYLTITINFFTKHKFHNLINFSIFFNSQIVVTFIDKFIFYKPRFLYKFINFNVTNIQLLKVSNI